MANKTIAGNPRVMLTAVEQPIEYITDQRTGAQTVRRWRGPYLACLALIPNLVANGWNTQLNSSTGVVWNLQATIGLSWSNTVIADNPVDTWELHSNKVEKDFLNAQNALVASLSPTDIKILQNFLDNTPSPLPTTPPVADDGMALSTAGVSAYQLILLGVKSVVIFQPLLKHTQTTSNIYAIQASFTNVGQILSTATMLTLLPGTLAFTMPTDPTYGKTGFSFGWLKDYPNVTVSAFNKTQISQDFEFGLWNNTMFNVPL